MIKLLSPALGLLFFTAMPCAAHMTVADPGFVISSDFGPRILGTTPDFHKAIDWSRSAGQVIPLLENGSVMRLSYSTPDPNRRNPLAGGILIMEISGAHNFRYLHMFANASLPMDSGEFTLALTDNEDLAIIRWSDKENLRAQYAIGVSAGDSITIDGDPVLNAGGTGRILTITQLTRAANSYVGPSGGSGGYTPHMHVDLGADVCENPLAHIEHAQSNFEVKFLDGQGNFRNNGYVVSSNDAASTFIKVQFDSGYAAPWAGKDLDKLEIYVDNVAEANLIRRFAYGGLTAGHDPVNTDIELDPAVYADGIHNGVQPGDAGLEDFVYTDWESAQSAVSPSRLTDGEHHLIACWTNIRNTINCSNTLNFSIKPHSPIMISLHTNDPDNTLLPEAGETPFSTIHLHVEDPNGIGLSTVTLSNLNTGSNQTLSAQGAMTFDHTFQNLEPGPYWIRIWDLAGNQAATNFKIFRPPPSVSLLTWDGLGRLYDNFSGPFNEPLSLAPAVMILPVHSSSFTIDVNESHWANPSSLLGIRSLEFQGPHGPVEFKSISVADRFNNQLPGVTSLSNLPDGVVSVMAMFNISGQDPGVYTLTATNGEGQRTVTPFIIGNMYGNLDASSYANFDPATMNCISEHIVLNLSASRGLQLADQYQYSELEHNVDFIRSLPLSGTQAQAAFDLAPCQHFLTRVSDAAGNMLQYSLPIPLWQGTAISTAPQMEGTGLAFVGLLRETIVAGNAHYDSLNLGMGVELSAFDTIGGGAFSVSLGTLRPDLGYQAVPLNTAFEIAAASFASDFVINHPVTVSFLADASALSSGQKNLLRLVSVGKYNIIRDIPFQVSASASGLTKITFQLDFRQGYEFYGGQRFMLMSPEFPDPVLTSLGDIAVLSKAGQNITVEAADPNTQPLAGLLSGVQNSGYTQLSNIYILGPEGARFSPAPIVTMRHSDAAGGLANILDLSPGMAAMKLPGQVTNYSQPRISALLPEINSYFGVFSMRTSSAPPNDPGSNPNLSGVAIAIDPAGNIWEIIRSDQFLALAKHDAAGVFISSTPLPEALDSGNWDIRFDDQGAAFAVGVASGPDTIGIDLAVYKVAANGHTLISKRVFNSVPDGGDIALDAAGSIWITGALGAKDGNGQSDYSLGLWKYDLTADSISLKTSYSNGNGFDVGTGVALDSDGAVWVVGFSSNTATPGPNKLDLALWKFDPTSTRLIAGPFLRHGYAQDTGGGALGAKLLRHDANLYVAASRWNDKGNSDLTILGYDTAGTRLFEKVWHSEAGAFDVPKGFVWTAGSMTVAGVSYLQQGQSSATVWRVSLQGDVLWAKTVPGQPGVRGAAAQATETWLAVTHSSAPYHFTGGTDIAGAPGLEGVPVDDIPPMTTLSVNGLPAGAAPLVLASTDSLGLSAIDAGTGVSLVLYSLDASSEQVYASTFSLHTGTHSLAYHSVDNAGNAEAAKTVFITVQSLPSESISARLDYPSPLAQGVEQAVGAIVDVRGEVSGAQLRSWTLSTAAGAAATSGFKTIASGASSISGRLALWDTKTLSGYFTLKLTATDDSNNASSTLATVFVGRPIMDFAIGRRNANAVVRTMDDPEGLVVRPDGGIWVTADDSRRIILISSTGAVAATVGTDAAGPFKFKHPTGLALDAANNLYVADRDNDRIAKLSPDGSRLLYAFAGGLQGPNDAAVDADGSVYVADTGHGRVRVFAANGTVLRDIPIASPQGQSKPWGVALSSAGLWVSDRAQRAVSLFMRNGTLIKKLDNVGRVRGAAVDRGQALYVADRDHDRIDKFDPNGALIMTIGPRGWGRGEDCPRMDFWPSSCLCSWRQAPWGMGFRPESGYWMPYLSDPADAAMSPDGALWVADSGHDRIVRYVLPPANMPEFRRGVLGVAEASADETSAPMPIASKDPAARVVNPDNGGKVERDDGTSVRIPVGALSAEVRITVAGSEDSGAAQASARKALNLAPASDEVSYGPEGTLFSAPVTLTISYDPAQIAANNLDEDKLKVHYWNQAAGVWEALDSVVDKTAKTVSARTEHFSTYQVMGGGTDLAAASDNVALAQIACNPLRPNCRPMLMRNLPANARLRIYTLTGALVKDINADSNGQASWDGTNQSGASAASGVYFMFAQGNGTKKTIKIAVER